MRRLKRENAELRRANEILKARSPVLARTRELLDFARRHGFGRDEIIQVIDGLP